MHREWCHSSLYRLSRGVGCLVMAVALSLLSACGAAGPWDVYDPVEGVRGAGWGAPGPGGPPDADVGIPDGRGPSDAGKTESPGKPGSTDGTVAPEIDSNALLVWGELPEGVLDAYQQAHPDRTVIHDPLVDTERWISSLASERSSSLNEDPAGEQPAERAARLAPDVFAYPAVTAGWAIGYHAFEDLSGYDYPLPELLSEMSPAEKAEGRSLDGYRRMAITAYTYPMLLAYRTDALAAAGWPTDPDAVALRLEDPAAWLALARTMHEYGKTIMEWSESPWAAGSRVWTPFRSDLSWRLGTDTMRLALAASAAASMEALSANADADSEEGRRLLREGTLVMCLVSAAELNRLPEWVPEQAGLWRVTRMPMGLSSESGTIRLSMNQNSTRKQAAWDLITACLSQSRLRQVAREKDATGFYGGQDLRALVEEARLRMEPMFPTPFDGEAAEVFWNGLYPVLEGRVTAARYLERTQSEIEQTWRLEISALRRAKGMR